MKRNERRKSVTPREARKRFDLQATQIGTFTCRAMNKRDKKTLYLASPSPGAFTSLHPAGSFSWAVLDRAKKHCVIILVEDTEY